MKRAYFMCTKIYWENVVCLLHVTKENNKF